MKAVVINATNKTVKDVVLSHKDGEMGSLKVLQEVVGGLIERAPAELGGDDLFVNEEGAINGTPVGFLIQGRLFAGNGVIVGHDGNGNTISAKTKAADLKGEVTFAQLR